MDERRAKVIQAIQIQFDRANSYAAWMKRALEIPDSERDPTCLEAVKVIQRKTLEDAVSEVREWESVLAYAKENLK